MVDISALFGASSAFGDIIAARSRIPGKVGNQTVATVKDAISSATRLSEDGKKSLSKLTDTVNQFAKGNDKLLRDIVGISNLQQIGAKEQNLTGNSPYAKLLSAYYFGKPGSNFDYSA